MCTYIEYSFFSNRVSLKDCCVQECSFYCWYFSRKLDSKVISIGFLNEKSSILFLVACKAGKFCWGCDQFGLLTDRELGRVKKMILREKLTPCLPFLHITFGSRFKKKKKKKTPALQGNFLVHEYNLKIPFQCFISINSNTDPNLSNTFNLVTSSLLLMGQVSFPIPLGFQSQVED